MHSSANRDLDHESPNREPSNEFLAHRDHLDCHCWIYGRQFAEFPARNATNTLDRVDVVVILLKLAHRLFVQFDKHDHITHT